jgi:hypothetical protein
VVLTCTAVFWITATVVLQELRAKVSYVRVSAYPAYLCVLKAKRALSDAGGAARTSFRSPEAVFAGPGQRFWDDIATATQQFQQLAELSGGASSQLQTANGQLVIYESLVERAGAAYQADAVLGPNKTNRLGFASLGYALQARSGQGGLLANVHQLAVDNEQVVMGQLASVWADPVLVVVVTLAGFLALGSFIAAMGFLRRRFSRSVSPPLLLAAALLCGLMAWETAVILPADAHFAHAREKTLPNVTSAWAAQTKVAHAGHRLDRDLAKAQKTGGLPVGLPIAAVSIAALTWLGFKPRLDEYQGRR